MTPAGFHRPELTPKPRPVLSRQYAAALREWVQRRAEIMAARKKDENE